MMGVTRGPRVNVHHVSTLVRFAMCSASAVRNTGSRAGGDWPLPTAARGAAIFGYMANPERNAVIAGLQDMESTLGTLLDSEDLDDEDTRDLVRARQLIRDVASRLMGETRPRP